LFLKQSCSPAEKSNYASRSLLFASFVAIPHPLTSRAAFRANKAKMNDDINSNESGVCKHEIDAPAACLLREGKQFEGCGGRSLKMTLKYIHSLPYLIHMRTEPNCDYYLWLLKSFPRCERCSREVSSLGTKKIYLASAARLIWYNSIC